MKKAAFFVEGQTELIFVRRLLEEMAGARNIAFHEERWHSKTFKVLSSDVVNGETYYAMIVDCFSDNAVLSALLDRRSSLQAQGYDLIVGLRDLYPTPLASLPATRAAIASVIPVGLPETHVTVAITEVESWFVQENTHFPRIDPACSRAAIQTAIGYDIDNDLAEQLVQPSKTLDDAYRIASKRYSKSRSQVSRTVRSLDFAHLYLDRRAMLVSFDEFAGHIDGFLS